MKVLLAGGGTAGHTSPLLATAAALQRADPATEILCVGTPKGLENTVVPEAGYDLKLIPTASLPRSLSGDLAKVPFRVRAAVKAAREIIGDFRPDVIIGYGGYVSLPVYLAGKRMGVPVIVHEQNALPGLANRLGARIASRVAVSFPDTKLPRAEFIGLPLRSMISSLDRAALRTQAREFFDLDPQLPTLLVTGGSQGARAINHAMTAASGQLREAGIQVLHVIGPKGEAVPEAGTAAYRVLNYIDRIDLAYAAADLVLCRAGASSVSEAASVGLPAIFVPLPIGNGEQELNARPVVEAGGGLLVANHELTQEWVATQIPELLGAPARLQQMGAAAAALVPSHADDKLAAIAREAAGTSG